MVKMDIDVLITQKIFSSVEENEFDMWLPSIKWKLVNISQVVVEQEKMLVASKQMKMKILDDLLSIITNTTIRDEI